MTTATDVDDGFAAWCFGMCIGRLRRRLAAGLPLSAIGRRTLRRFGGASRDAFTATFVERPDPTGARWATALGLLLEAGREATA